MSDKYYFNASLKSNYSIEFETNFDYGQKIDLIVFLIQETFKFERLKDKDFTKKLISMAISKAEGISENKIQQFIFNEIFKEET